MVYPLQSRSKCKLLYILRIILSGITVNITEWYTTLRVTPGHLWKLPKKQQKFEVEEPPWAYEYNKEILKLVLVIPKPIFFLKDQMLWKKGYILLYVKW